MHNALIQMTALMLLGASWRVFSPNQLQADQTRLVLTTTVYYFFLPAMVLSVLWQAELGKQSLQYSLLGCLSILAIAPPIMAALNTRSNVEISEKLWASMDDCIHIIRYRRFDCKRLPCRWMQAG